MNIQVNGTAIPDDAVFAEMQYHPARSPEEAFQQAARALVVRELLMQAATAAQLDPVPEPGEDDEQAMIRAFVEREIDLPEPDEEACRRFYENHKDRLRDAEGNVLPYGQAQARIAAYLTDNVHRRAVSQLVQMLAGEAEIKGIELDRSETPLVQ